MEKIPSKSWDSAAYDKQNQEWVYARLHSYDHQQESIVQPVKTREIKKDRRKPFKKPYKELLVFGDSQIGYRNIGGELVPIHDERAINAITKLAEDRRPHELIELGDTTDFAELSRFAPDSNHFQGTLQPSMQRTHEFFADLTEVTPGSERHTVDSNHVKRLGDYVLKHAMPLADLKNGKYPAISYPGLLQLDQIGWEFHGGYGAAEYAYADDLAFKHGNIATKAGTARKLSESREAEGRNIVQGHAHRIETQYRTDRSGKQLGAFVVGALCRTDGFVPSYYNSVDQYGDPVGHYEDWQNGFMVVKDYGEGRYQFDQVPIHDGKILYEGKSY